MKKRLTSVLLTICLVASLFSAMGVTAYADMKTIEYTLKAGDNVYKVCQRLGIDFYANYDWITKTNNITNYSTLPVGRKIILPLGEETTTKPTPTPTPTPSAKPSPTPTPAPSVPPTTTVTTPAKVNLELLAGDTIKGYLVPYVVSSGDTLYDICLRKGINYNSQLDYIMKINGLKNANRIAVGRTLLLPSSSMPEKGACVAIVAHKIVSGDATYNLCKSYNIDYNDNLALLMALNGKNNMAVIKVGQTLLIPVPTSVTPSTTVTVPNDDKKDEDKKEEEENKKDEDKTEEEKVVTYKITKKSLNAAQGSYTVYVNGETSDTAEAGDKITIKVTAKPGYKLDYIKVVDKNNKVVAKNVSSFTMPESNVTVTVVMAEAPETLPVQYKITKNSPNVNHGSYNVLVNNSTSSDTAEKGDIVTINVKPKTGYALDYIKVVDKDGNAVALNETTFTMPESDVTIDVIFVSAKQYKITSEYSVNGSYVVTVNGVETTYASEGQTVVITPTPNYNYELDEISYRNSTGTVKNPVVDKSFVMPAKDVTVSVTFRKAEPHAINTPAAANGTYEVKCNGTVVKEAKAGQIIDVVTKANEGYQLKEIKVVPYVSGVKDTVAVENGSFVMPEFPVQVQVTFKAEDFSIISAAMDKAVGEFTVVDGYNKVIDSADTGAAVYVKPAPAAGHTVDKVTYTDRAGKVTEVAKTGDLYYFAMPASDITVKVTFKTRVFYLSAHADSPAATFTVNGKETTRAYMGETVTVNGNPAEGVQVKEIKAYNTSNREIPMTTANTLKMPAGNVVFKVVYELKDLAINKAKVSNGTVEFKKTNADGDVITTAHMGDKVYVAPTPNDGYSTSKIVVTYADGTTEDITASQTFTMPNKPVSVAVTFLGKSFNLAVVNSTPSLGSAHLELPGSTTEIGAARVGETVKIVHKAVEGCKISSITVVDENNNPVAVSNNSFKMPNSKVTVTVKFELVSYNISASSSITNGSISFKMTDSNGNAITKAQKGDVVYIVSTPKTGYHTTGYTVVDAKGNEVAVNVSANTFVMPASNVTVTATYAK